MTLPSIQYMVMQSQIGSSKLHHNNIFVILRHILIAPQITKKNIFMFLGLVKINNAYFVFYLDDCVTKDLRTHQVLLEGCETEGLYKLIVSPATYTMPES